MATLLWRPNMNTANTNVANCQHTCPVFICSEGISVAIRVPITPSRTNKSIENKHNVITHKIQLVLPLFGDSILIGLTPCYG